MYPFYKLLVYFIILIKFQSTVRAIDSNKVYTLMQGDKVVIRPRSKELNVFCYIGKPKYIIHIWQSVILEMDHPTDDYTQYEGPDPESVEREFLENRFSWNFNFLSSKQKTMKLDPFNTSCIGIVSPENYTIYLRVIQIDMWKVILLATGIFTYLTADKLSRNTMFHYICGVSFGIAASFLIVVYFMSKLVPKRPFMYGVLGTGWTIVVYIFRILWDNVRVIFSSYRSYVMWYTAITGIISFILCYRWGKVENPRTVNLIRWSLQAVGIACIFFSSHYTEAAAGQIVLLWIVHNTPQSWISGPKTYWKRKFPPKIKLLTNDQYYEQGVRETSKALEGLRSFCRSPECEQWKLALKIKDVKRFASFIEGNSHLSDDEILEYETSYHAEVTDDETSDENTEEDNSLED